MRPARGRRPACDREHDEPEPALEDVDEEPQRREAVGVLVDGPSRAGPTPATSEGQPAHSRPSEPEQPAPVVPTVPRAAGGDPDDEHGQRRGEGELTEALARSRRR